MRLKSGLKSCLIAMLVTLADGCSLLPGLYSSDHYQALLNQQLGSTYLQSGLPELAKAHLDKALALDDSNAQTYNYLAVYYQSIQDQEQAGRYYQTAMTQDPDDLEIQANYGGYLCATGHQDAGIALIKATLDPRLNSQLWQANTQLGLCYLSQNQLSQAEQHFREALASKCDYTPALLAMQKFSYQTREYLSARGFWERYLQLGKASAESLWLALQTERALGNMQLTERYRQQLLSDFPNSQQAQQTKTAISN